MSSSSRLLRSRLAALAAATAAAAVAAGSLPAAASPPSPRPPVAVGAPAAPLALAAPSPDLLGLPAVSLDLADVAVDSAEFRRARARYEAADRSLTAGQAERVAADRALTAGRGERARWSAQLAASQARAAASRSRLDEVTAAIGQLGVDLFVSDGSTARLDAALASDNPSIGDADRRDVLGTASLDVLLAERAAYQQRLDAATAAAEEARQALQGVQARQRDGDAQRQRGAGAEADGGREVAGQRVAYEHARVLAGVEGVDFQLVALDAYHRAAATVAVEQPACALRWWGLAGISKVEGRHGTYGGAELDEAGDPSRPIIGIPLDGTNETAAIADSDRGRLDGDPHQDRAVGPMQFIPQTWYRFAADGNGDGTASPFNLYDATLAAARYLCRASGALDADPGLRTAYLSYNQSLEYVETVLRYARSYEAALPLPDQPD